MKDYIIAPEGCRWSIETATTPETAYSSVCCWYLPDTRIAVIDPDTGHADIFTRTLDRAGNMVKINAAKGGGK